MKRIIILTLVLIFAITNLAFAASFSADEMPDKRYVFENNISIPGFSEAEFIADEAVQSIMIYNPPRNNCEMVYMLCLDNGEIIWKSKPLQPGYGYQAIELNHSLPAGEYKGSVAVRCYSLEDRTELNGVKFGCTILVK